MKKPIERYCSCGASFDGRTVDVFAALAEWNRVHVGFGHNPCSRARAVRVARRAEVRRAVKLEKGGRINDSE